MMRRHPSRRRPGNVLIWFALTVWVLFALAALVIDLGLVRATQRQMQTAADMGAIEGVRSTGDPTLTDETMQRQSVSSTVASAYLDSSGQQIPSGDIGFTGGIEVQDGFMAAQKLSVNSPGYLPNLSLNTSDAPNGDMAKGAYDPTMPHTEADDYTRPDFAYGGAGAFLVRLRRSNESFASGDPSSSAGPALPYVFARGSVMASQSKADGITVRATSIAAASPVLSAGPSIPPSAAVPAPGIYGVAPFGLTLASWQAWRTANPSATTLTATVDGAGNISGNVSGLFTARPTGVTVLGQALTPSGLATTLLALDRYVPLYDTVGGIARVVGFLHAPAPMLNSSTLTIPISTGVAAGNATAALAGPLPTGMAPADLSSLFMKNASITDPLRAAALVR